MKKTTQKMNNEKKILYCIKEITKQIKKHKNKVISISINYINSKEDYNTVIQYLQI